MQVSAACVCVLLAVLGPGLADVLESTGQQNPVQPRDARHRTQQCHNQRDRRAVPSESDGTPGPGDLPAAAGPPGAFIGEVPSAGTSPPLVEGVADDEQSGTSPALPDGAAGSKGDHDGARPAVKADKATTAADAVLSSETQSDAQRPPRGRVATGEVPEASTGGPPLQQPLEMLVISERAATTESPGTKSPTQAPVQPVQPEQPLQPVQPPLPVQPVQPPLPVQPVQPVQPQLPVQPVQPVQPPVPVQPLPVQPPLPMQPLPVQSPLPVQQLQPEPSANSQNVRPLLPESQRKQEGRRKRLEKLQRDLLERREKMKRKMIASEPPPPAVTRPEVPTDTPGRGAALGAVKETPRSQGEELGGEDEAYLREAHRLEEPPQPVAGRQSKEGRPREQEAQDNLLSLDWDPNDISSQNSVEWDGLVCPAVGDVSILSTQCRSDKDCPPAGERCCKDRWGLRRCVQGVQPKLPDILHEPFFGVIARVCPSQSDTMVEPWAVTNCTTDDDCWPRVCCVDGPRAYCRTPQIEWEKLPGQRFVAPLRLLMSYLQCTPAPPPMFDLFPKPCRNTLDCFPNLCCQEHGNKVCRPPKRSLLALLATIGQGAALSVRPQQPTNGR